MTSRTIVAQGTATISSTSVGPGGIPYVTVTGQTGLCTATGYVTIMKLYPATQDVLGSVGLTYTRASNDTFTVYADRQLPAGQSIGFDWIITAYVA